MATWTAKTMMATTKAPRNDLRLMPWKPWALPAVPSMGVLAGACVVEVDDRTVDAAVLAADETVLAADETVLAADDTSDADDVVDDMVASGGSGAMKLRDASPRLGRRCAKSETVAVERSRS